MFTIYSLYVHYMFTISSLYVHHMVTIHLLYIHFIIPLQCFTNADWLKNPNILNVGLCSAVHDQHSSRD